MTRRPSDTVRTSSGARIEVMRDVLRWGDFARLELSRPTLEPWRSFDRDETWRADTPPEARTCHCDGLEC